MYLLLYVITYKMHSNWKFMPHLKWLLRTAEKNRVIDPFTLVLNIMCKFLAAWIANTSTIRLSRFKYTLAMNLLNRVPTDPTIRKAYNTSVLYNFISNCPYVIGTALINIFTGSNCLGALNFLKRLRNQHQPLLKPIKLTLVLSKNLN